MSTALLLQRFIQTPVAFRKLTILTETEETTLRQTYAGSLSEIMQSTAVCDITGLRKN
jgi:hypothetical protein